MEHALSQGIGFSLLRCFSAGGLHAVRRVSLVGSAASGEGLVNVYRGTGKVLWPPTAFAS